MPALRSRQGLALALVLGSWLLIVAAGMNVLWDYESTAGVPATPPAGWPAGSHLWRAAGRPTLLMFAHPHCPCTRASLEELDRLLATLAAPPKVHVLFARPPGTDPGWVHTDLWRRARAMPGVSVHRDDGGEEARRFGAATSGQAMLYDTAGRLRFTGGLTAARGHAGDNPGRSLLTELLRDGTAGGEETPVFGCSLAGAPT